MLTFRDYLDYANKYVRLAEKNLKDKTPSNEWLLIPATILAWTAIESFVNNRLDDYKFLPDDIFELHEKAFLTEKKIRFVDRGTKIGQFELEGKEYKRLEDKIFFLMAKFSSKPDKDIKGKKLWQDFEKFKETRDSLVHPRRGKRVSLNIDAVRKYIETSKEIIQLISTHIWNKQIDF